MSNKIREMLRNRMDRIRSLNRKLAAQYTLYALFMTFIMIVAYSALYPALRAVLDAAIPTMGEAEGTILSLVPLFILLFILWSAMWYVAPKYEARR